MSAKSGTKKTNPLSRKIPENPRYRHVKPTVDTGASMRKYLEHLEDIKKDYKYKKDEIFSRLKVSTFAQLVIQVTRMNALHSMDTATAADVEKHQEQLPPSPARSSLSSVVMGTGELDISNELEAEDAVQPPSVCPYLLLDLRDKDDYDKCHVISAKCYPITMLSRSCNYFTQDILEYKNKAGRIIILYDEDERIATQAATVFVQRGVDNAFLLSGGLKVLYKTFPVGMITGQVPMSCLPSPPLPGRKQLFNPVTQQSSLQSFHQNKEIFTFEDIDAIQGKLDEILSSRLSESRSVCSSSSRSTSSRGTRMSGASVKTTLAGPWK